MAFAVTVQFKTQYRIFVSTFCPMKSWN